MDYNDQLDPSINTVASLQQQDLRPIGDFTKAQPQFQQATPQDMSAGLAAANYQNNPRFAQPVYQSDADRIAALQVADQTNAAAQRQQRIATMPTLNTPLSSLEAQDAQVRGFTPQAYRINQRLQATDNTMVQTPQGVRSWTNPQMGSGLSPDSLLQHPQFQQVLQQNPQKASDIFQAVTGQDLGQTVALHQAEAKKRQAVAESYITSGIKEGRFHVDPETGAITSRKMVSGLDPTKGGTSLSADFSPLDPFEQQHFQLGSHMIPAIAAQQEQTRSSLLSKKNAEALKAAQLATMQNSVASQGRSMPQEVSNLRESATQAMSTESPQQDLSLGQMLTGQWNANDNRQQHTQGDLTAYGVTPQHARTQAIFQTPTFRKLMKEDYPKAMQIILSHQLGQGQVSRFNNDQSQNIAQPQFQVGANNLMGGF